MRRVRQLLLITLLLFAVIAVFLISLHAYPSRAQAYLKVERMAGSKGKQTHWQTSWGSYERDYKRTVTISIFVRGMGVRTTATLEWYFIAKDIATKQHLVFDSGSRIVALDPREPFQTTIKSI